MTRSTALKQIRILTRADTDPTLDSDQLALLVEGAKRKDSEDRAPSDAAWVETYDIPYAVMQGWEMKAANAASQFDFSSNDQKFSASQLMKQCLQQKAEWARKVGGSIVLTGALYDADDETDDTDALEDEDEQI